MNRPSMLLRLRGPAAWLAAGAAAAMLGAQVVRLAGTALGGTPALADLVNQAGDHQMLAVDGGLDDVMVMVDQRSESILVYRATQTGVQFLGKRDLRELFFQARQAAGK